MHSFKATNGGIYYKPDDRKAAIPTKNYEVLLNKGVRNARKVAHRLARDLFNQGIITAHHKWSVIVDPNRKNLEPRHWTAHETIQGPFRVFVINPDNLRKH